MIVFKTFLNVLKACKVPIIMYTVILVFFGAFNMQTSEHTIDFVDSKPSVTIVNRDEDRGITSHLIHYMESHTELKEFGSSEEVDDALFYRDISYVIFIPEHFRDELLSGKRPHIEVKSTKDYGASLSEMMLNRYLKAIDVYLEFGMESEDALIRYMDNMLLDDVDTKITSTLDTGQLSKASFYYNFASYSLLAGCVYVICLILSSFQSEKIRKRTIISSMSDRKYNTILLLSNLLFAILLWFLYVVLSFILIGNVMFSAHGLLYILNSFVFVLCALSLSFMIGKLISNKNAINGIVNVVALGSSFLCGAFVPMEWLPPVVLKIAHLLPSYYYIKSNNLIEEIEVFQMDSLVPIILNMVCILGFAVVFIVITQIVSRRKRTMG